MSKHSCTGGLKSIGESVIVPGLMAIGNVLQLVPAIPAQRGSLYFGGTNYLGLANSPFVKSASALAALVCGTSFSASRATTGTSGLHLHAERKIAEFMGTEDACLMTSGAHANAALMELLARRGNAVMCERSAHPSLIAAARASFRHVKQFDFDDLAGLTANFPWNGRVVIVMNGVHPVSGRIAPLDAVLRALPRKDFYVAIDDCHAVGVLGENGRGTAEHFGITSDKMFQTATMSKAFGCHGGFIAGSREFCLGIRQTQNYTGATALPPADTAAAIVSMTIALNNPSLREKLHHNIRYTVDRLIASGISIQFSGPPIIQITNFSGDSADEVSRSLFANGIYVPSLSYPNHDSPKVLRIAISAAHTKRGIDRLCRALVNVARS